MMPQRSSYFYILKEDNAMSKGIYATAIALSILFSASIFSSAAHADTLTNCQIKYNGQYRACMAQAGIEQPLKVICDQTFQIQVGACVTPSSAPTSVTINLGAGNTLKKA
jgi:hypothetical protein